MKKRIKVMNIEIRKQHIIALIVALVVIAGASILIPGTDIFYFLIGLAALIAG
ncbi:hypothetical protein GF386_04760, partial [Candidatus Pacearchaeota archaeon]|nr:hypothetical protein [Candidatus Pacearchaeota archaeon]MBD3283428.1 hypothetical protein [Candidatus Pacearchaeota archaeon]